MARLTFKWQGKRLADTYGKKAVKNCASRVAKGTRLVDKKIPATWKKVTLSELDLSSPTSCVLGQAIVKSAFTAAGYNVKSAYSRPVYGDATDILDISGVEHGFDISQEGDVEHLAASEEYDILNHLWVEAIRQRRRGEKVTARSLLAAF
jgi:hypothetical protein